jgi:hypothetical protein
VIVLPLTKKASIASTAIKVLSHPATTTAATVGGAIAPIIDAEKKAGIAPLADLASKTVGVLAHPAASTAATVGAVAAPFVAQGISDRKAEKKQSQDQVNAQPLNASSYKGASFPKLGFIGAIAGFMAKPAVAAGLNVMGAASMASSLMGGNNGPAAAAPPVKTPGRVGANATPSGAFGGQGDGQTVTAGLITPQQTIPSELQVTPNQPPPIGPTGPMGAGSNSASPPISQGRSKASPGAPSAFKGSSFKVAGWLDNPRLKRNLDLGSQAAVIGSAALPAYQLWRESRKEKQDEANISAPIARPVTSDDPRRVRVASMLPLQPKQPILDRLGSAVRDFGEGAANELDHQAEKQLTPSMTLDPLKTRTPSHLHLI